MKNYTFKNLIRLNKIKKNRLNRSPDTTFYKSRQRGFPLSNTKNRTDLSGKKINRHGFVRYSSRQQSANYKYGRRLKRHLELYQTQVKNIFRTSLSHKYVNIYYVDYLYQHNKKQEIFPYIYSLYVNFDKLWNDYMCGFRDKIFTQILRKTNSLNDDKAFYVLKQNYLDIFHDVMTDMLSVEIEKIKVSDYKFGLYYKLVISKIPFLFSFHIRSYLKYYDNVSIEYNENEELGYEDSLHNLLQIDIIDRFQKIK